MFFYQWACAAGLKISPTRIDLSSQEPIAIFEITNTDIQDALVESQLMRWTQKKGEDHYSPTKDILMIPPMFKLKPNQKQIVRFALRRTPHPEEMSYRVFLTDVVQRSLQIQQNGQAIKMKLRIGIPIFVSPSKKVINAPQWTWEFINKKTLKLTLNNKGNVHIFIDQIQLFDKEKSICEPVKTFKYLLPGTKIAWKIAIKATPITKNILVLTDDNGNKSKYNAWLSS